ncbi:HAD family phosphatase [Rhodopseudomonas palustris]|uniref:HAD family phosphatase n=1 Tax=Rhodopseudomonas palustris TaxID=1076 RepID=A0AAX3DYA5_RHOPL|nr:HAD family phosphatase [Rhodopseudomonas palustris]UYO39231.1 HAD family phosphatase [Rhodopseudomonas palustris]
MSARGCEGEPQIVTGKHDWLIAAVLLDMDGTLVDTERVYLESLTEVLNAFGLPDATKTCESMVGLPGPECQALLVARYGETLPLSDINRAFVAKRDARFAEGLPVKPGTCELLDALDDARCPVAVVTSSSRKTADMHLTLAGIRARFGTILTRDDVAHGKPAPDLYLLAADRLGVPPAHCVAVEDSSVGVASAFTAGAITLMVPDLLQPDATTRGKCAAVLPDLHGVLDVLQTRGRFAPVPA